MGQYDQLAAKFKALLAKKCAPLELHVYTGGTAPDPTKPWRMTESAPTVYPFKGYLGGFGVSPRTKKGEQDYKCIIPGDVAAYAPDIPSLSNTILKDASDQFWSIDAFDVVAPDGGHPIVFLAKVSQWPART